MSSVTNIALLLQDGTWMTQSFPLTTTLWQVLLGFEQTSNGTLNLTRSIGTPSSSKSLVSLYRRLAKKGKSKVYMLPSVTLLDREYSSIHSLQSTTLEHTRTESGSLVMRITMRHMKHGIDKYIAEIERGAPAASVSSSSNSFPAVSTPPARSLTSISTLPSNTHSESKGKARAQDFQRGRVHGNPALDGLSLDPQGFEVDQPQIPRGRTDSFTIRFREGHLGGPGNNGSSSNDNNNGTGSGDGQRQTPSQDISSAMVETTQEIRQLREQQTQEAMTDRVKRLSKSAEGSSDKDRFVRGMDSPYRPMVAPLSPVSPPAPSRHQEPQTSLAPVAVSQHDALVRQIAHRVSQQLKEAQQRGDSATTYRELIAQEIAKGQRAGVLPASPAESRKNSAHAIDPEDQARLMKQHSRPSVP
ncbi:hypothetical protein BGZ99_008014 [Dissophora globulifera]|uniref:Uncharacterized protein n=1 Tax=Dissophora globulifera TaxID=979702 RepID=A0A9P6RZ02_9FUNG|nr:hypothetical protein BGZ99_008014 [Dissophora globulifera]